MSEQEYTGSWATYDVNPATDYDSQAVEPENPDEPIQTNEEMAILEKLDLIRRDQIRQAERLEVLAQGINQVGEMLNFIVQTVNGVAQQFQNGGISGLMGMLGGKQDG